ncbi:MAG: phytanoyl-CoA dioxygenase family protein [Verrucomicrobiota bacterium]
MQLTSQGFEIHRRVLPEAELKKFRIICDQLIKDAGTTCVRHIDHLSDPIKNLSTNPCLLNLIPAHLSLVRSILFDKTISKNWPVAWHQDLTIALKHKIELPAYAPWSVKDGVPHVQPPTELLQSMTTIRIHLDDTPAENGALRVIPASHQLGKIPSKDIPIHSARSIHICECQAGDILTMSPLILHSSPRSTHPSRRRVIHFEYAPLKKLDSRLQWHSSP